ncbi:hypothetical protein [Bifidobacterium leontopitheci]|uniref:Uncharacterized protein n=1 Tax=Bifidobacterium leontopitheci TaxID=2650774 RepID=A0A6I1GK93_9BIFI|nr:hypothetical protein [Bifidobacterium leontopitheci]KAB7789849.1 hypothetical protein F7D09_1641 [Bifidobacterium leontopitheci]
MTTTIGDIHDANDHDANDRDDRDLNGRDDHANDPPAALLDTADIARFFERHEPDLYYECKREFDREVDLNPYKRHSEAVLNLVRWMFYDWFAFECAIVMTGKENADGYPQTRRVPRGEGISPFGYMTELAHVQDMIDDAVRSDLKEVDATNKATIFWIRDANAATQRMRLEDVMHGGEYTVYGGDLAARYDGAHGGMLVNRIARVRGMWRFCAVCLYESRRPDTPRARQKLLTGFGKGGYQPDFPGLVRFFYGRAKDTGLDWEETEALLRRRRKR